VEKNEAAIKRRVAVYLWGLRSLPVLIALETILLVLRLILIGYDVQWGVWSSAFIIVVLTAAFIYGFENKGMIIFAGILYRLYLGFLFLDFVFLDIWRDLITTNFVFVRIVVSSIFTFASTNSIWIPRELDLGLTLDNLKCELRAGAKRDENDRKTRLAERVELKYK